MSCVRCQRCERIVDSDEDMDCFVNDGDVIACERCREKMEERGELDVETNRTINGETFAQFHARVEAEAPVEG